MKSETNQLAIATKMTRIVQSEIEDEVRDREDEPEEDGGAVPVVVVLDHEANGVRDMSVDSGIHRTSVRLRP